MKFLILVIFLIGFGFLILGLINLFKLKSRIKIFKFDGNASEFKVFKSGNYYIAIEGRDFNQINRENLFVIKFKEQEKLEVMDLKSSSMFFDDGKPYSQILQINLTKNEAYCLVINNYSQCKTNYTGHVVFDKFNIKEKYTKNKPPKIIIIESFSDEKIINTYLFLCLGVFICFFGLAAVFLGGN